MKHLETILSSGLLSKIGKADYIVAFESLGVTDAKFKKGENIFEAQDLIDKICIVEKGSVHEEKVYTDGEVCILHVFYENSIVALETVVSRKKTAAVNYVCNEDCSIVFIPYKNIEKSKWAKEIMAFLMEYMADNSFRDMHKFNILARRGVRERILMYLHQKKKLTRSNVIDIRMDREQLAQYLCVNRSCLSNELNQLKREGIIDFKKNVITLLKD